MKIWMAKFHSSCGCNNAAFDQTHNAVKVCCFQWYQSKTSQHLVRFVQRN